MFRGSTAIVAVWEGLRLHVCAECERPSQLEPLLEMHRPDLLIIDLNMSEGGGSLGNS